MSDSNEAPDRRASLSEAQRALLEKRLRGTSTPGRRSISPRPSQDAPPLSFGQRRLWFLSRLNPSDSSYNMHTAVRIKGPLDVSILQTSLVDIVARHEILRTTFPVQKAEPVQAIASAAEAPLTVVDLQNHPDPVSAARELAVEEACRPFNLDQGPLMRTTLLQLGGQDHVLVIIVHHITFDEWSVRAFWQELSALYDARLKQQPATLPELKIQYGDYAYWQQRWVQDGSLDNQLDYWKSKLDGELPVLQLPADFPRPAVNSYRGALSSIELPEALLENLKSLCRRSGTTMFMTLLACFKVLLYHLSQQSDLLVGTPVANRDHLETESLIGFFLNTVVLRTDLAGNPTFLEVLLRVKEGALSALANPDLPFEMLVQELQPERNLSYNPLFQVMFVHAADPSDLFHLPGLDVAEFVVDPQSAKFDLTLFTTEKSDGLSLTFEYNTDLYAPHTVVRWLHHLKILLDTVAANPETPLDAISLLDEPGRHQILHEWNNTSSAYPQDALIHHLIEQHARRRPQATAVVFDGASLSYAELDQRANQLARRLTRLGVGPESVVGICLERSLEMIVAMCGVLKAGGAYVPLDPDYPADRLGFLIEDSQAAVLLTHADLVARLPENEAAVFLLDAEWSTISGEQGSAPEIATAPENLAYVIYTSGSTGKPKGVQISHRNLVHSTTARYSFYPEPVGRFLLLSSFSFDSSVVGLYWSLCQGGTLVLPRQGQEQSVRELVELIANERITHLLCLPSLYSLILEYAEASALSSLTTVMVAGEACPPTLVPLHYAMLPNTALYNEYGPTEGTVWSVAYRVPADWAGQQVPIGRPIPNMQAYILNDAIQPLPIGVPGELFIAGDGIARGYLNRSELTAERFMPNPFSQAEGARMYRTGDLVRWLSDGNIEFLGRIDNQIKIRGHRVELDEIGATLSAHPVVRQAIVVANSTPVETNATLVGLADELLERLQLLEPEISAALLQEIEDLSDEEVRAILAYQG